MDENRDVDDHRKQVADFGTIGWCEGDASQVEPFGLALVKCLQREQVGAGRGEEGRKAPITNHKRVLLVSLVHLRKHAPYTQVSVGWSNGFDEVIAPTRR